MRNIPNSGDMIKLTRDFNALPTGNALKAGVVYEVQHLHVERRDGKRQLTFLRLVDIVTGNAVEHYPVAFSTKAKWELV